MDMELLQHHFQLAKGYAILSNGGYKVNPTLIKKSSTKQKNKKY